MLDGSSGYTLDGGKTWEKLAQVSRGWDFAAVDWSVEKPEVIFGFEHESGGNYHLSSGEQPLLRLLDGEADLQVQTVK